VNGTRPLPRPWLSGLPNARDLGGYRTRTGAMVRRGVLFHGDAPVKATDADLTILAGLGIVQVMDLRGDSEIQAFGIGRWDVPRIRLPVADTGSGILAQLSEASPRCSTAPPGRIAPAG
jgi:protein-tyrosine phosphatase